MRVSSGDWGEGGFHSILDIEKFFLIKLLLTRSIYYRHFWWIQEMMLTHKPGNRLFNPNQSNVFHVMGKLIVNVFTHSFPMHPFSTPWKHQKAVRFSNVFWGWRKSALGANRLNLHRQLKTISNSINMQLYITYLKSSKG